MDANEVKNSQYFQMLPPLLQESIMQSGFTFRNEDELRQLVESFQGMQD